METGTVFNIQKFCIHDGDGIRTCVFLKGCPLRCVWCHNPESLEKSPSLSYDIKKCSFCGRCLAICGARSFENNAVTIDRQKCIHCGKCTQVCPSGANEVIGSEMTSRQVFDEVMKDRMFYETSGGGLTVTGGEPSFQPDFALELLRLSKDAGISVAIETCGIGPRDFYEKAVLLGATFLFDIKCIDSDRHKVLTGADNAHILANLIYLMDNGADIIIRLPMIPDCNDSDADIASLAAFLNSNKGRYRYAEIMPYHTLGIGKAEKLGNACTYVQESAGEKEISRWVSLFNSYGTKVKVSQ